MQFKYWLGLFASVATAVAGQSHLVPEPYQHWVSLLGIIGTAVTAYLIKPTIGEPPK